MPAELEVNEDEEVKRLSCIWLSLISLAVVGFIILTGGLVALFVHFDPLKEVDLLLPQHEQESRQRRFYDVALVSKKLNFTDAEEYCSKNLDGAILAFPRSYQEEDRLEKDVTYQIQENGTDILKKCGNRVLIGIRKSVDAQWILSDGSSALSMPKLHDEKNRDFDLCSKIVYEDDFVDFHSTKCEGNTWNCILCEYMCPDKSSKMCYTFWENINLNDYDAATQFCQTAIPRGNLASVNHSSVLKTIEDKVKSDARTCQAFGVGNRMISQYESSHEEPVPYKSIRIINMRKVKSDKSCVAMNIKKQLRWQVAECSVPRCFVCVRENKAIDNSRSKQLPIEYD